MASSSSPATSAGNPYRLNAEVYDSRLTKNASRLFSTDAVRVIHCDGSYSEWGLSAGRRPHADWTRLGGDLDKETAIREYLQVSCPRVSGKWA